MKTGQQEDRGRPTKLTEDWLEIAEEVINDDINAIILTDDELVLLINDEIDKQDIQEKEKEKQKISDRTFKRWKKKNKEGNKELDEIGKQFCHLIKKALLKQKKHLFNKFRSEEGQWQKWAWIIERKFGDWNIKYRYDHTTGDEPINSIKVEIINGTKNQSDIGIQQDKPKPSKDSPECGEQS